MRSILTIHLSGPGIQFCEQICSFVLQGIPVLSLRPGSQSLFYSTCTARRLRLT